MSIAKGEHFIDQSMDSMKAENVGLSVDNKEGSPFNPEEYSLTEILKPRNCVLLVIDM